MAAPTMLRLLAWLVVAAGRPVVPPSALPRTDHAVQHVLKRLPEEVVNFYFKASQLVQNQEAARMRLRLGPCCSSVRCV